MGAISACVGINRRKIFWLAVVLYTASLVLVRQLMTVSWKTPSGPAQLLKERRNYSTLPKNHTTIQIDSSNPVNLSGTKLVNSSRTKPVNVNRTIKPIISSRTKPVNSSRTKPVHSSRTKPIHSSRTKPIHSSRTKPEHSSRTKPVHSSRTKPVHSSWTKPVHSSRTKPVHSSWSKPVHSSWSKPVHSSRTKPVHSRRNKPVKSSRTKPVNSSRTDVVNPGCKARSISKYVAPDLGRTYCHPSIVHYAKFNSNFSLKKVNLNFREYISVLSTYKFLKPKQMIFHTFTNFSGHYWEVIRKLKNVDLEVNVIPVVSRIGGKPVKFVEHQADYVKLSMLYKYGGTALDFDVIMINGTRWSLFQRRSECVLVEEVGIVNGGLYSCIANSTFVAKWLEGYHKDYKPKEWVYNASKKPLHLLQSNVCYNVHVDRTVCFDPSYNDRKKWLKVNGVKWKFKTAAHYFIKKEIPNDGEGLLKDKFSLAKLIQYVYKA